MIDCNCYLESSFVNYYYFLNKFNYDFFFLVKVNLVRLGVNVSLQFFGSMFVGSCLKGFFFFIVEIVIFLNNEFDIYIEKEFLIR